MLEIDGMLSLQRCTLMTMLIIGSCEMKRRMAAAACDLHMHIPSLDLIQSTRLFNGRRRLRIEWEI